jgi:hypothetical protein
MPPEVVPATRRELSTTELIQSGIAGTLEMQVDKN